MTVVRVKIIQTTKSYTHRPTSAVSCLRVRKAVQVCMAGQQRLLVWLNTPLNVKATLLLPHVMLYASLPTTTRISPIACKLEQQENSTHLLVHCNLTKGKVHCQYSLSNAKPKRMNPQCVPVQTEVSLMRSWSPERFLRAQH